MDIEDIKSLDGNSENDEKSPTDSYDEFDYDIQNSKLEGRVQLLKDVMNDLKKQLSEEKEIWKKEVEEAVKLTKSVDSCNCDIENSNEGNIDGSFLSDLDNINSEPTLNELSILDYETKLASYQEALTKAHVEKRNHLRRQLAANAYKRRLLEVENMCNMELLKVKQCVQFLQPLQAIASEWSMDVNETSTNFDEELTGKIKNFDSKSSKSISEHSKIDFPPTESADTKLFSELKEMTSQMSPLSSNTTSTSLYLTEDDDSLMMKRIQSMSWYNNEMNHSSAFNPLM